MSTPVHRTSTVNLDHPGRPIFEASPGTGDFAPKAATTEPLSPATGDDAALLPRR
jgi:hypothetical protein